MSALAQMVEKAAEETELCKRRLTRKDLLKACEAGTISPEQLKEMANALYLSKEDLSALLEKLCEADLLDLEAINLNAKIGECDCEGLAAFLEQNAGKMSVGKMVALWCEGKPGRGGVTRGRGDAPMIWGDETSEEGAKFEEEALPPGAIASMKESGLIGVSMGAPTEEGAGGPSESGALSGATAGGGSAFTQNVLPRHRGTVERYFERE
jgi:hypothetical protein